MGLKTYTRKLTQRGAWLIATFALIVVLALSACAGRGGAGGQQGSQSTGGAGQTTVQTTGGTSSAVDAVAQTDSDLNSIVAAMDSISLDAGIDESGKDIPVQP